MIRPILVHPDPILRAVSVPVPQVTGETRALLDDMLDTMYDAAGRGLAGIQIGIPQRLVVIDCTWKEGPRAPMAFVNPEIVWRSDVLFGREERCLSIPDTPRQVLRPDRVRLRFLDREGDTREIDAEGVLATVIQHEVDHLDGVLILDHDVV